VRTIAAEQAENATIERASIDGSTQELLLRTNKTNTAIPLALHAFPGWKVTTLAGPQEAVLEETARGTLRLRLPARGKYRVRVSRGITTAGWLGGLITATVAGGFFVLLFRRRPFGGPATVISSKPASLT
jgi:hypothetical protein